MSEFEELAQQIEKFKSNMNSVSSIKESLTKILEVLNTYEKKLIEISLKYEDIRTDIRDDVATSLLDTHKEYLKSISEFKIKQNKYNILIVGLLFVVIILLVLVLILK